MRIRKSDAVIIKLGGSCLDLGAKFVKPLCQAISELAKTKYVILTTGGGLCLDTVKDMRDDYKFNSRIYESMAHDCLRSNASLIKSLVDIRVNVIQPHLYINKEYHSIYTYDSDATLLAFAESINVPEVIFLKDTDGIYTRDPNIHKNADFIKKLSIADIHNISRIGIDNRGEHLIDNKAIKIFKESHVLKKVKILDCKDPYSVHKYLRGDDIGSEIRQARKERVLG